MLRTIIKILLLLSGLLLLVGVLAGTYMARVDLNDHREEITGILSEITGYPIQLHGTIEHSIYPWLGVTLDGVEIDDAQGLPGTLLSSGPLKVRMKLMPMLLFNSLQFDIVQLHGLQLHLVRNADGVGNWQLPQAPQGAPALAPAPASADDALIWSLSIAELRIEDAALGFRDEASGRDVRLESVRITGDRIVAGEVPTLQAEATLVDQQSGLGGVIHVQTRADPEQGDNTLPLTLEMLLKGPTVPEGQEQIRIDTTLAWQSGAIALRDLEAEGLTARVRGQLQLLELDSTMPRLAAQLEVQGQDIALPFRVANIEPLAGQLAKQGQRDYSVNLSLREATAKTFDLETLELSLLGARINARAQGSNLSGSALALSGTAQAEGPDLPLLLRLFGAHLPRGNALSHYGEKLAGLDDRGFALDTRFDVDLQAGRIELPALQLRAPGVQLTGQISSGEQLQGQIELSSRKPGAVLAALGAGQDSSRLQELTASLTLAGTTERIRFTPLSAVATLAGKTAPLRFTVQGEGGVDRQQLQLSRLALSGAGIALTGEITVDNYPGEYSYQGTVSLDKPLSPRALLQDLGQSLPPGLGPDSLRHLALDKVAFSGDGKALHVPDLQLALDDSRISGSLAMDRSGPVPDYQVQLAVDQIDLDRYLPAKKGAGGGGSTGAGSGTDRIPDEALDTLRLSGQLQVADLTLRGIRLQSLLAKFRIRDGVAEFDPLSAELYGGRYAGSIQLDGRPVPPTLALSSSVREVQMGRLLEDFLATDKPYFTGRARFDLQLSGAGADSAALLAGLSGKGRLEMQEGVFTSFNIGALLLQVESLIRHQRLGKVSVTGDTRFDRVSASLDIKNGVVHNEDLSLQAPGFLARGTGMLLDLRDASWDYRFSIATRDVTAREDGGHYELGGYPLSVRCTGLISKKRCLPDVEGLLTRVLGKKLRAVGEKISETLVDGVGNVLGEALLGKKKEQEAPAGGEQGASADGAPAAGEQGKQSADTGEEKGKEKIEDQIKEKVMDSLLDKLL